jgi:hypothetical protein
LFVLEQEIDGNTLLNLTENMIAKLLPTMNLQVRFRQSLNILKNQCGLRTEDNLTTRMTESMIDKYTPNVAKYFALLSFVYFIFS